MVCVSMLLCLHSRAMHWLVLHPCKNAESQCAHIAAAEHAAHGVEQGHQEGTQGKGNKDPTTRKKVLGTSLGSLIGLAMMWSTGFLCSRIVKHVKRDASGRSNFDAAQANAAPDLLSWCLL